MKLFLMRHGDAEPYAACDRERPLTARGRLQVQAKAEAFKARLSAVSHVYHSTFLRARETAGIIAEVMDNKPVFELASWAPESAPERALETLETLVESTPLIVTHMPLISYVEALLCQGSVLSPTAFNCAEIVEIEAEWPALGLGTQKARL